MVIRELPYDPEPSESGWVAPLVDPEEIAALEDEDELDYETFYLCANCGFAIAWDDYDDAHEQL
jgi:hypothetical protein